MDDPQMNKCFSQKNQTRKFRDVKKKKKRKKKITNAKNTREQNLLKKPH